MSTESLESYEEGTIPDDFLVAREGDIDTRQLMNRIEKRVANRREEIGSDTMQFPSYTAVSYPGLPDGDQYDPNLYHHLRLANRLYSDIETSPVLESSPATRLPLVGRLWRLVRLHAHNLVLFYVNRAVSHDVVVNRHLVSVLNSLTEANRENQVTIRTLEDQLRELRSRLDQ